MENEVNAELDMERDPLKIPEVLETIFGNISNLDDMRIVRGVSNKWREVILKKWRESATLQITLGLINKFYEEENELFLNNGLFDPKKCQYVRSRLSEKPFKNYRVPFFPTSFPPAPERFKERFFWNKIGPHMKILNLEQCVFPDNLPLEGLQWILLKQCQNLEELRMKPYKCSKAILNTLEVEGLDCKRRGIEEADVHQTEDNVVPLTNENLKSLTISCLQLEDGVEQGFSELFYEGFESHISRRFFRMIPNLKSLSVKVSGSIREILKGLSMDDPDLNHISQLENLEVDGSTCGRVLEVFRHLELYFIAATPPLKKLKIRRNWPDNWERKTKLNTILEPVLNTLTILEIILDLNYCNTLSYCKYDFENLKFPHLQRLILQNNLAKLQNQMSSIAFPSLKFMPRLKEFRLECIGPSQYKGFLSNPDTIKMEDLRMPPPAPGMHLIPLQFGELEEFHFCGRFTQAGLHHLGHCAPTLKKFAAICEIKTVQAAITAFGQLNELRLLPGSRVGDKDLQTLRENYPAIAIVKIDSL